MATIIDALIVTLGLDSSGFEKGADKVAKSQEKLDKIQGKATKETTKREKELAAEQKKRAQELEARSKAIASGISKIRNEALGMFAVFTAGAGIKSFIENTIGGAAGLGMMASNLGMSTESLQAWQRAAERAGGTAQGMVAQLKESNAEIARLKLGMGPSEQTQWFFRMGGDAEALKDGNSYLMARAAIVEKMFKVDQAKAALAASQMGISEDQFNLIKQGPAAILALVEAQRKHSAISDKDSAAALKLKNRWLDFKDSINVTSTRILVALIPTFNKIMGMLEKFSNFLASHSGDIERSIGKFIKWLEEADWKAIGQEIQSIADAIVSIAAGVKSVSETLTGSGKVDENSAWEQTRMGIGATLTYMMAPFSADARSSQGGFGGFKNGKFIREGSHQNVMPRDGAKSNAVAAAQLPSGATVRNIGGSTSTTSVTIGNINVQTQATDAKGIAAGIGKAVRNNGLIGMMPNANPGVQ